jgi:hypothetical protein
MTVAPLVVVRATIKETVGTSYIVWDEMFLTMEAAVEYIDQSCENEDHRNLQLHLFASLA